MILPLSLQILFFLPIWRSKHRHGPNEPPPPPITIKEYFTPILLGLIQLCCCGWRHFIPSPRGKINKWFPLELHLLVNTECTRTLVRYLCYTHYKELRRFLGHIVEWSVTRFFYIHNLQICFHTVQKKDFLLFDRKD